MKFSKGSYKILFSADRSFDFATAKVKELNGLLFEYNGIKFGMSKNTYDKNEKLMDNKFYTITEISTGLSTLLYPTSKNDVERVFNENPKVIELINSNNTLMKQARNFINKSNLGKLLNNNEKQTQNITEKKEIIKMTNKERFIDIVNKNIHREGIDKLMDYLEKSDFYTAPASTRFHDSYEGGLLDHSLRTYDHLKKLVDDYGLLDDKIITEEMIAIIALFHDLCKVDFYKVEQRWRKNENNQWESYDTYAVDEQFSFGGHGSKSVFIVQSFIKLRKIEASAINCHMGMCGDSNDLSVGDAFRKYPIVYLLHVADMMSTIPGLNEE